MAHSSTLDRNDESQRVKVVRCRRLKLTKFRITAPIVIIDTSAK